MIKTPLAAAVYALVESNALDLSAPVPIEAANMTVNDAASPLEPGHVSSIPELVRLMIARSDNVATNQLIDLAGRQRATSILHGWGLSQTHVRRKLSGADPLIDDPGALGRNAHPAEDAAKLFSLLATGKLAGADAIVAALSEQVWNDKLSRGWRPGDRFAHKTGDTSEVSHDGGILDTEDGRRYVIVVYTSLSSGPDADARIAAFARLLRPYL